MDLIGPWVVQVHGTPYEFDALLVINTETNLVELIRVDKKISDFVARKYPSYPVSRTSEARWSPEMHAVLAMKT